MWRCTVILWKSAPLHSRTTSGGCFIECLIECRLESLLPYHQDQTVFKHLDGIAFNAFKVHAALSLNRSKYENLVASVDIRKAFDPISHELLLNIRQRKESSTSLWGICGKHLIHTKHRGVKQVRRGAIISLALQSGA